MSKPKLLSNAGYHVTDYYKTEDEPNKEIFAANTASDVYVNESRNTLDEFLPTISSTGDSFEYPMTAIEDGEIETTENAAVALLS